MEETMGASELVRALQSAVVHASVLSRNVQRVALSSADKLAKADSSPVTVADFGAQVVVSLVLKRLLGAPAPLMGEEDAATLRGAGDGLIARVVAELNAALPKSTYNALQPLNPSAAATAAAVGSEPWSAEDVLSALASAGHPGGADAPFYVLDPIDGTKGFVRQDQYAIGLAYVRAGVPVAAAIACPNLPYPAWPAAAAAATGSAATGSAAAAAAAASSAPAPVQRGCVFTAATGHGARMQPLPALDATSASASASARASASAAAAASGAPAASGGGWEGEVVRVNNITDGSRIVVAESYESGHSDHGVSASIAAALGVTAAPIRIDSMSKYCLLSRGDASVYLRFPRPGYVENIWDHAPGWLICREAGGRVTDARGAELDFSRGTKLSGNEGVIATNGVLHDAVLAAVAAAWKRE